MDKSFCFFFQKEQKGFFLKKEAKTFTQFLARASGWVHGITILR
jgi:hypothetical protein